MAFQVTSGLPGGWRREVISETAGQHHTLGIVATAKKLAEAEGREFHFWLTKRGVVLQYSQPLHKRIIDEIHAEENAGQAVTADDEFLPDDDWAGDDFDFDTDENCEGI